ncbi:MAG: hypothetical protein IPL21_02105 [Saprospirales bacterium]|nr:hypothetical protein [Saprospirales bacterium]
MGYGTTWIDENFDTTYLQLGLINLKDSGIFMCILPLSEKYGVYSGNVYKDRNANCSFDANTDSPFKGRTIEVTKTNVPIPYKYYDYTDNNGKFEMYVDSGSFTSKVLEPNNLWQACPTTQTFSINGTTDTVNQNFYLKRLIACPNLSVSIDNSRLRPCMSNTYVVNHCNTGTADAIGATVVVDFDSLLAVNSASVPYTNIGNKYTFQVGTIKEDSCGLFTVNTTLNCSAVLGTTQCVEAHIYPDSVCTPIDPRWDRANVSVDGRCLGDSVLFRIRNIGSGNMSQIKRIYCY